MRSAFLTAAAAVAACYITGGAAAVSGAASAPDATALDSATQATSSALNTGSTIPSTLISAVRKTKTTSTSTKKTKSTESASTKVATGSPIRATSAATKASYAAVGSVTVAPAVTTAAATGSGGTTCTVTEYASISSAVAACSNIVLSNISAPPSSTIDLQKLQPSAVVIFAGTTTFGTTEKSDFEPIVVKGDHITITGEVGHVINGNGAALWDGKGSNGGREKPDHFFVIRDTNYATISNLKVTNWPTHCFYITGNEHLTMTGITLDNSDGDKPNSASGSKAAAHNTDGFDILSSDHVNLDTITVHNQDDCVAVASGSQIIVNNVYCYGGHGLSIGSVGGKSNNTVAGVTFSNSQVVNSSNGCRIKSNSGKTGSVTDITYQNITMSGISKYGLDIQQDYLNGGPTGKPTNGVTISGIKFVDISGTVKASAKSWYILCGDGSCSDFTFKNISITGGTKSCNYPASGCP